MKKYKIGYVPGVFDLFHVGHLQLIRKCKNCCDFLIVGVLSDELVAFYKGEKPYIPYEQRAEIIKSLRDVDRVVSVDFSNTDKLDAWRQYHYDCHFSGDDHGEEWNDVKVKLQAVGSNLEMFSYTEGVSSTKLKSILKKRLLYEEDFFYTFDVFDTLITRNVATPKGIFTLIQNQLESDFTYKKYPARLRTGFYDLRIYYEGLARKIYCNENIEDISLETIYKVMAEHEELSVEQMKSLAQLERDVELNNIIGIEENIDRIKKLNMEGRKIALISDMYLEKNTIKKMLLKADAVFKDIPIYVSSEYGKLKATRNLYKIVKEEQCADLYKWVHFGDNLISDIKVPEKMGIKTIYFDETQLSSQEKKAITGREKDFQTQKYIGICKNKRLKNIRNYSIDEGFLLAANISFGRADVFPFGFFKNRNVALYAAGNFGEALFEGFKHRNQNIGIWVDKNYKRAQEKGLPVDNPERLLDVEFDYIVIAVLNPGIAEDIKKELYFKGIAKEKIIWIDVNNYY